MREMSVSEPRYKALLAALGEGRTATEVAGRELEMVASRR
jgi:hypothetical protein